MDLTRFDPRRLAAIYAGGVAGALARVGLAQALPAWRGHLALGDLRRQHGRGAPARRFVAALRGHRAESPSFALLTTGFCGTLTTFATMQLELFEMVDAGHLGLAAAYVAATVAAGFSASVLRIAGSSCRCRGGADERRGLGRGRAARRA